MTNMNTSKENWQNDAVRHEGGDFQDTWYLFHAIDRGDEPAVTHRLILADRGLAPPVHTMRRDGRSPLAEAARQGKADVVMTLLAFGADPNEPDVQGITPLKHAFRSGDIETVKRLLEWGADPLSAT